VDAYAVVAGKFLIGMLVMILQIITATRQASPTGTIDLNGTTLSVTGLATEERKGLTPEAAAPVVHAVANCQAAGLTTLQLNDEAKRNPPAMTTG